MFVDMWHVIYNLLAFPGTLTVVTTLALGTTWFLYDREKRNRRKEAAAIVLIEIEEAENRISETKKTLKTAKVKNPPSTEFPEKMQVMKTTSWTKHRHLLSGNLSPKVSRDITLFYENCALLDDALAEVDAAFSRNESEIRANAFRKVADYMDEKYRTLKTNETGDKTIDTENTETAERYEALIKAFTDNFPTKYAYAPVKPYQDAEKYLDLLPTDLSETRVGSELRKLMSKRDRTAL
jgi:cbb3-type cytochrome oxidase subunit 3